MNTSSQTGTEAGEPAGVSPARWRQWLHATRELAEGWTALLLQGMPPEASFRRDRVRDELLAYARTLLGCRLGGWQPMRRAAIPGVILLGGGHPTGETPWTTGDAMGGGWEEEGEGCMALPESSGGAAGPVDGRFTITPEVFQRFSRLTGMDSTCLAGTPELRAGLTLYLVVFSWLTSEGDPGDLEMQRLLKKLRLCREQFQQQVESLFGQGSFVRADPRAVAERMGEPALRWLLPSRGERDA